jgi:N-acetylglucosaminyldiphosphoundecaprenol N-acetyl-beta-D-mannosaminyltransferase
MRNTVNLFGIEIDPVDMRCAVAQIVQWAAEPRAAGCRYVVTPNVDHVVMYQTNPALRASYESAALVLADGAPVVLASRLLRKPLPERVAGSDLTPALFASAAKCEQPLRVFLLGAAPGVAERAREAVHRRWTNVEVVGTYSPPLGFEHDAVENQKILALIAEHRPDVLLIGLGAPKQELWIHAHADALEAKVALCVGATIDFLAGEKHRSPGWMRWLGLEWLHRLASEPSRLAKRYLNDAWVFPQLVWREWRRAGLAGSR